MQLNAGQERALRAAFDREEDARDDSARYQETTTFKPSKEQPFDFEAINHWRKTCWSLDEIVRRCEIDEPNVRRIVGELSDMGLLSSMPFVDTGPQWALTKEGRVQARLLRHQNLLSNRTIRLSKAVALWLAGLATGLLGTYIARKLGL